MTARLAGSGRAKPAPPPASAKPAAPRLSLRFEGVADRFRRGAARLLALPQPPDGRAPDPAKILFPAAPPADDDILSGPDAPLGNRVRASAGAIVDRQRGLAESARRVARAIDDRFDGAVSMTAWKIRLVIALLWGLIAVQLVWARLTEASGVIVGLGVVPDAHIRPLAEIFIALAFLGMAGVVAGAALVALAGNADNRRVRMIGGAFGEHAADVALGFDGALDRLRRSMDERHDPVDAVTDLSRAHLTALEAAVFFRDLNFITDESDAAAGFRGYMDRFGGGGGATAMLSSFVVGAFVGANGVLMALHIPVRPRVPDFSGLLDGAPAPWILFGMLVYLFAGFFARLLRPAIVAAASDRVRGEALEAIRSGFVAKSAPRVEDVVRRIDDSLDIFKARVAGRARRPDSHAAADDEIPLWRRPPEAPRFVETAFPAAPKSWRADPPAPAERTRGVNFSRPGPGPKRGLFGLKKPPVA
ncbi:MAG: hypothetical protein AB7P23_07905 [Amphiplicatus sp.]